MHLVNLVTLAAFAVASPATAAATSPATASTTAQDLSSYESCNDEIADACCDYATAQSITESQLSILERLVREPYFRYFKVDLGKDCPFWRDTGSCMSPQCHVETSDEQDLPPGFRQSMSKVGQVAHQDKTLSDTSAFHDDLFCALDDVEADGAFVDLVENPERYTGYGGESANNVWRAIYTENCFSPMPYEESAPVDPFMNPFMGMGMGASPAADSSPVPADIAPLEDMCLEERIFYRLISGLHASISMHICKDYYNPLLHVWEPRADCYAERIGRHPDRIQNLYFTYVVLQRALAVVGPQILGQLESFLPSSDASNRPAYDLLSALLASSSSCNSSPLFDESELFLDSQVTLKEDFRLHFLNISRIMDCVGCEKCRLWGKVQTTGLATALRVLFVHPSTISRAEAVTFINVLHRLTESIDSLRFFQGVNLSELKPAVRETRGDLPHVKNVFAAFLVHAVSRLKGRTLAAWARVLAALQKSRAWVAVPFRDEV